MDLGHIRLILYISILYFACVSIYYLSCSIFDINEAQRSLEKQDNVRLDISEFRFEKEILVLFGVTITCVFLFGLIAVRLKSVCMLLFYSTTGCGMFLLLLLILYVEHVVPAVSLIVLTLANLLSSLLGAYYAFNDNSINYESMVDKPYTINLI